MGFNEILKNARMSSEEVNFSYVKEDMNALYLGGQYLDLIDTPALTAIAWADQNQLAITSGSQAKALYELYRQGLISGEEMIPVVIQSMPIRGEGEPIQPRFPLASPSFFQTNSLGQRIPLTEPFPRIEP